MTRDSGIYTCVVTNGLDKKRASATLIVKDQPESPLDVKLVSCTDLSAEISWAKGPENNDPIQSFSVQYNTSFSPLQWISATSVNHTQTFATVSLKPWANYTFRVIATNEIGDSSPSLHTQEVCRTPPSIPYTNPKDVRSVEDTKYKLKIRWTPMEKLEHNGPGFGYELKVKDREYTFEVYKIDDWRTDVFEIPSYEPYKPYLVTLRAVNDLGWSQEEPMEYELHSFEDVPIVAPTEIDVIDIESTSASVIWKWDSTWLGEQGARNQILGQLKGFLIRYWRDMEPVSTVEVPLRDVLPDDVPPAGIAVPSSYQLTNLPENSNIHVDIRVLNNFYEGPSSDTVGFNTLEGNRPPSIYLQSSVQTVYYRPGETLKILCKANGNPKPKYHWKYNGELFYPEEHGTRVSQVSDTQGTIVIHDANIRDEGLYQCFADNGLGISASDKIELKAAKIGTFHDMADFTHHVSPGQDLTLPCYPPLNDPPGDIFWAWKGRHDEWVPITLDDRVTTDFDGRLRFANVLKSDEMHGEAYYCLTTNQVLRTVVAGPAHYVKVTESADYPLRALWISPSGQYVLKGETLRLKCIYAGNPTPEVTWRRRGGKTGNYKVSSFGQEMYIENIQESDTGDYACEVQTHGAFQLFHIIVQSAPYWIKEPENIEAGVNENATFVCNADGNPKPDIYWYINGVSLEDRGDEVGVRDPRIFNNERFFQTAENSITLTKLALDDHMNIQCNASNIHGYVFSDVYLHVFEKDGNY